MQAWHVICCSPTQEIRASIELTKAGFDVFFPIKRYVRQRQNRPPEIVTGPLFPRYLFVTFDRESTGWGEIKDMRGVSHVLSNGNKPVIVRPEVVEAIRAYREPERAPEGPREFAADQKVRIATGVLAGVEGLFTGSDRKRTKAFLEILGKRVEVPLDTIEAA